MMKQDLETQKEAKLRQAKDERDREINKSETELNQEIKRVQGHYKMWAVVLPPIPPLLVALVVFFTRRRPRTRGRVAVEIAITGAMSLRLAGELARRAGNPNKHGEQVRRLNSVARP